MGLDVLIYWIMFLIPAVFAVTEQPREGRRFSFAWLIVLILLIAIIGFRWRTGGDWQNYARNVEIEVLTPRPFSLLSDPGFTILLRFAAQSPVGMLLITGVSGLMMGVAITRFSLDQPRPWLCMAVAVPYLIVVMGMGYIRQGMAISCLMMGLASLKNGKVVVYSLWVLGGALFHSTALILLPLGALVVNRNIVVRILLGPAAVGLLGYCIVSARTDALVTNYVDTEMSSSGAAIRLFMTALPAGVFLRYRSQFRLNHTERAVWSILSAAGLVMMLAFFASPSSTVVDRLALYLLPVQCFVYSRAPAAFARTRAGEVPFVLAILILYATAFAVWLNFANNVYFWIPYRFYFFEDGICLEC